MIRGPGNIVSFFELFSIDQLFFPIHLDAKLKKRNETLVLVISASRVFFAYLKMTFMHCLLIVTTFQNVHQCLLSIGSSCDVEKN